MTVELAVLSARRRPVPDTASVRLTVTVSPVSVSATDALPLALSLVLVSVSVLAIGPPKTFGVLFAPTA